MSGFGELHMRRFEVKLHELSRREKVLLMAILMAWCVLFTIGIFVAVCIVGTVLS